MTWLPMSEEKLNAMQPVSSDPMTLKQQIEGTKVDKLAMT